MCIYDHRVANLAGDVVLRPCAVVFGFRLYKSTASEVSIAIFFIFQGHTMSA